MINSQYGEASMIHRITYPISMLLLKEEQQRKLLRALFKTRKNIIQRSPEFLSDIGLGRLIASMEPRFWFSLQYERKTKELREKRESIETLIKQCRDAFIPEWMIKPLVWDYKPPTSKDEATSQI